MSDLTFLLPYLGRWDQFRKSRFHQISERLASAGHTVHVVQAPDTDSEEVTFSRRAIDLPENVVLHDAALRDRLWNAPFANKILKKGYYGIGVRRQVARLVNREDVDILWLYNLPHYPLARAASVPIVFDIVDDYLAMLHSELGVPIPGPVEALERQAFGRLLGHCDLVTVISHELRDEVRAMVGDTVPTEIVPNGVDTGVFDLERDPPSTHQEPPVVGFVGSFEYFIDFDLMLDAAAVRPDIKFLLVGDGREFEYARRQCARRGLDNVELPGLVESDEVPGYIDRMDICLNTFERIPLAHSAVPLKLFEYLSRCRPVVSTRIREVQRIDDGYLYYADTPRELVSAIETICDDYAAAIERTKPALALIGSTYNWDTIATTFERVVRDHLRV